MPNLNAALRDLAQRFGIEFDHCTVGKDKTVVVFKGEVTLSPVARPASSGAPDGPPPTPPPTPALVFTRNAVILRDRTLVLSTNRMAALRQIASAPTSPRPLYAAIWGDAEMFDPEKLYPFISRLRQAMAADLGLTDHCIHTDEIGRYCLDLTPEESA